MDSLNIAGLCIFVATVLVIIAFCDKGKKIIEAYGRTVAGTIVADGEKRFSSTGLRLLIGVSWTVVIAVSMAAWLIFNHAVPAIVIGLLLFFLPRFIRRWTQARRRDRLMLQLPDALMMLAGALRAGAGLGNALGSMATEIGPPISQEFALLLREQRVGVTLDDALINMECRIKMSDFALVLSAIRIAREVGGNLAETLERLAHTLRQKASMEGKIRSLTAQGKLQGIVVGLLPIGLAAVLLFMDPSAMLPLVTSPIGWATCAVIGILELLGAMMIRKIVMIDV